MECHILVEEINVDEPYFFFQNIRRKCMHSIFTHLVLHSRAFRIYKGPIGTFKILISLFS